MLSRVVLFCSIFFILTSAYCEEQWRMDEIKILKTAQQENLPVVAVFLSVEGCPWSHKFVEDVLQSPRFVNRVGVDAILWEISLGKEKEDQAMRDKYGVRESPQIILLDPRGKEFARLGYSPLDAASYALEIMALIDSFQEVCIALDNRDSVFEEESWKDLYLKAKKFSVPCFKQVMLEKGLKKEKGTFFHVEKYASMLEKHKLKNPEVLKMKRDLLKRDPENKFETHFKVALLDFQKRASSLKSKDRYEKAIIPLLNYLHQFKEKDSKNIWKVELMISEYLYSKNVISSALEHAEESLKAAPESERPQVLQAISYMKRKQ